MGAAQAQGPADESPGSFQSSKTFSELCLSSKTLNRRFSRPILLIPYIISIPFKAAGMGESARTGSFGADGKAVGRQPRTAFPSWLPPHLQEEATLLGIHAVI